MRAYVLVPEPGGKGIDSVWRYHKYQGYWRSIDAFGKPADVKEYADRAQLVNYDQYRALMEGHLAHMWDWYTGIIVWKTQNPWTAMRGQMYDCYLDPNAGLYGLRQANEALHLMCNPVDGMLTVANNTFRPCHDLMVQAKTIDLAGKDSLVLQWFVEIGPSTVQKIDTIKRAMTIAFARAGGFLSLKLLDASRNVLSSNIYWFPDSTGLYTGFKDMEEARVKAEARRVSEGRINVRIENPAGGPLAFFLRIALVDGESRKRILPVFYSENYVSVAPGEQRTLFIEHSPLGSSSGAMVSVSGWNVPEQYLKLE